MVEWKLVMEVEKPHIQERVVTESLFDDAPSERSVKGEVKWFAIRMNVMPGMVKFKILSSEVNIVH